MKNLKFILLTVFAITMMSCQINFDKKTNNHPDFKIGKSGLEKALKKDFDFERLIVGTYMTKKNGEGKEKGLNLTFEGVKLSSKSDSLIIVYSNQIQQLTKESLLHLDDYDYVNITFKNEKDLGELKKINSIKVRKQL